MWPTPGGSGAIKVRAGIRHAGPPIRRNQTIRTNRLNGMVVLVMVKVRLWSGLVIRLQPAAEQMVRDCERMRRCHAVGMFAPVHQGRLGPAEPAGVLQF